MMKARLYISKDEIALDFECQEDRNEFVKDSILVLDKAALQKQESRTLKINQSALLSALTISIDIL